MRALWHLAAGEPMSARLGDQPDPAVARCPANATTLRALVRERLAGMPLAHQTERQSFMGIEMLAGPGGAHPAAGDGAAGRRAATTLLHRLADARSPVIVVDVCTGSGNVAAALALAEPRAIVYASDLSEDAVALARRNVAYLGLDDRVSLRVGDLLAPFDVDGFRGSVDLLTCNPPYISTARVDAMPSEIARHEPALAFDGGPLGVRILQRLIREAPQLLRPGGWLALRGRRGTGPGGRATASQVGRLCPGRGGHRSDGPGPGRAGGAASGSVTSPGANAWRAHA